MYLCNYQLDFTAKIAAGDSKKATQEAQRSQQGAQMTTKVTQSLHARKYLVSGMKTLGPFGRPLGSLFAPLGFLGRLACNDVPKCHGVRRCHAARRLDINTPCMFINNNVLCFISNKKLQCL